MPALNPPRPTSPVTPAALARVLPLTLGTAGLMGALDGHVDLANLALLLVLASALAALWLPLPASLGLSTLAVLGFNWAFVPPRGTFSVDLRQHAWLLLALWAVNAIVAWLMVRLRAQVEESWRHAQRADEHRLWADALRSSPPDAQALTEALHQRLRPLAQGPVLSLVALPGDEAFWPARLVGEPGNAVSADLREGLALCLREGRALGPGTGWHEDQPAWYLPWRAGTTSVGATHVSLPPLDPAHLPNPLVRAHAQALCDQLGASLAREMAARDARLAQQQAQAQRLRNTLLAAISHDYRTPLATILGAASALIEQADRLDAAQRLRLAQSIREQTEWLERLTDNTLQLARLDAPGLTLRLNWESAEEIVGAVLRRIRPHDPQRRVRAQLEPGLPLLRCDAALLTQMLDNLVNNALHHAGPSSPVELSARRLPASGELLLAVADRGPGLQLGWHERAFEPYQRGPAPGESPDGTNRATDRTASRGAGLGLALCRAIARAHGAELVYRPRSGGGACFECRLGLGDAPQPPEPEPETPSQPPPAPESRAEP